MQTIRHRTRSRRAPYAVCTALGIWAAALIVAPLAQDTAPIDIVSIEGGQVQGVDTDIAGVQLFKGLPYAASTAGDNRYRAPQPVETWEGVRLADTWGDRSMQWSGVNPVGEYWGDEFYYDPAFLPAISENGLNLNVFTPAKTAGEKLPVYVWIHGGGNAHGFASEIEFYASKLAAQGIVVVPIQYRVGAFAYLTVDELNAESPTGVVANHNLLDMVAALKWVNENIEGFGGDPSQVTIGGQSAGASNVVTLLRSPLAKGLFSRAVIESTAGNFLPTKLPTLAEQQAKNTTAIEQIFGKPMSVADLRAIPADDFFTEKVDDELLYYALRAATGGLVIDGVSLTEESIDLLKPGVLDGIDIMIGSVSDERTSNGGDPAGTMSPAEFDEAMTKVYGDTYKNVYMPSDPQNAYRLNLRANADNRFQSALISAQYAKANNDSNVFAFYFNHALPGRNAEFYGSGHSSELWYFFNSMRAAAGQRLWTDADYRLGETMSTYLANFVKQGDPNGEGLPQWPQPVDGPAFVRFADGYAYPVETTPYPARDAINRAVVLGANGLTEADLAK